MFKSNFCKKVIFERNAWNRQNYSFFETKTTISSTLMNRWIYFNVAVVNRKCPFLNMDSSQVTKVRNFPLGIFLWMMPRKFSRNSLELVNNIRDFLGFKVLRGIFPKAFLRISAEYFSGNSWEILRTWSLILRIFRGTA